MAQQHWTRWYTEEKLAKLDIKQLAKEHKAIVQTLEAFETSPEPELYTEQIREIKAVKWLVEETIRKLVLKPKK